MASKFLTSYVVLVHRLRYLLLLLWLAVVIGCVFAARKFPSAVTQDMPPPRNSQAHRAKEFYRANYYNASHSSGFVIFTHSDARLNIGLHPRYLQFDRALQYYITHDTLDFPMYGFNQSEDANPLITYSSFRAVDEADFPNAVALQYISETNTSAFATVAYIVPQDSPEATQFSRGLVHAIPVLLERYGLKDVVEGSIFSLPTFLDEIATSTTRDIIVMFGVVLPLALCVFAISLSSVRYVMLPLLALIASAILTFALMYGVAASRDVNSLAPGVCAALCLAFVIDYTYFVVAKYKKAVLYQHEEGMSDLEVVEQFLGTGGRAVFISSASVTACSIGIVFFPIEMLTTVGISCIVASLSAMVVALNLIPALILSFPEFFRCGALPWCTPDVASEAFPSLLAGGSSGERHSTQLGYGSRGTLTGPLPPAQQQQQQQQTHEVSPPTPTAATTGTAAAPLGQQQQQQQQAVAAAQRSALTASFHSTGTALTKRGTLRSYMGESFDFRGSLYRKGSVRMTGYQELPPDPAPTNPMEPQIKYHHRIVEFVTVWPQNALFVLLAIGFAALFIAYAFGGEYSNDITQFVPRNSALMPHWKLMQRTFKASEVFTFYILMDLNVSVLDFGTPFYTNCHQMVYRMVERLPRTRVSDFDGLAIDGVQSKVLPNGGNITFQDLITCGLDPNTPECLYRLATAFIFKGDNMTHQTYMMFRPAWSPTSQVGVDWYDGFKRMVPEFERDFGFKVYITGYGPDTIDSVEYAARVLPQIASIVGPIIFVMVTIAFGSLVIPLKCLLTVGMTIACCYGLAKLTFINGVFDFLQIGGLKGEGTIAWVVPLATFLITAGIALNYDLIVIVTILEFRWRGLDSHTAIIKGAAATGREITISAFMMFLIFSGLFLSDVSAMNELGMFLVASALFQGMFFRIFLTPSLMSLLGAYNWFPIQQCSALWAFAPPVLPPQDEPFPASPLGPDAMASGGGGGDPAYFGERSTLLAGSTRRSAAAAAAPGQEVDVVPEGQSMDTFRANELTA